MIHGAGLGSLHSDVTMRGFGLRVDGGVENNRGRVDVIELAFGHLQLNTVVQPGLDVCISVKDFSLGCRDARKLVVGGRVLRRFLNAEAL